MMMLGVCVCVGVCVVVVLDCGPPVDLRVTETSGGVGEMYFTQEAVAKGCDLDERG